MTRGNEGLMQFETLLKFQAIKYWALEVFSVATRETGFSDAPLQPSCRISCAQGLSRSTTRACRLYSILLSTIRGTTGLYNFFS